MTGGRQFSGAVEHGRQWRSQETDKGAREHVQERIADFEPQWSQEYY